MGYIFDNLDIAGEANSAQGDNTAGSNLVYNVGGFPIPEMPNFKNNEGVKFTMGSTSIYSIAGALGLAGIVFIVLKYKKGKG